MTPATLLTNLIDRGIEFQAQGDKLRFRPMSLLTQGEVETVRQHKAVILKLLRAEGQQAAEASCGKHDRPQYWVYSPDRYKRSGWQAVQCKLCSTFIGYQPPQQPENEMKCEKSIDNHRKPEPERPIAQPLITNTDSTPNHMEKSMIEDAQKHTTGPEKNCSAAPVDGPIPPVAIPAAVDRVAAAGLAATEPICEGTPPKTAMINGGTAAQPDELDEAITIAVRPWKPKNGSSVVSGKDKSIVLKELSSLARHLRKLSLGLYSKYRDSLSELIGDVKDL